MHWMVSGPRDENLNGQILMFDFIEDKQGDLREIRFLLRPQAFIYAIPSEEDCLLLQLCVGFVAAWPAREARVRDRPLARQTAQAL
jgi:hypothetical protein